MTRRGRRWQRELNMAFEHFLPQKYRPRVHETGRICVHPDCDTRLSIYNSGVTCYEHTESEEASYGKELSAEAKLGNRAKVTSGNA